MNAMCLNRLSQFGGNSVGQFVGIAGLVLVLVAGIAFGNSPPTVSITLPAGKIIQSGQIRVAVGENLCFQSVASDPDNDQLKYSWDFGDGSPITTTPSACHTYARPGMFSLRLVVDDGYVDPNTQSLLAGMTPANYALPAGWTLVAAQDFECANSSAVPHNPACGVLPPSQYGDLGLAEQLISPGISLL